MRLIISSHHSIDRRVIIKKIEAENVHQLRDYLLDLIEKKELRTINPTVVTFSLISSIHWLFFWYKPGGALALSEIVDQIIDIFLLGVSMDHGDRTQISPTGAGRRAEEDACWDPA